MPVNPLVIDEKNVQKLEHELDEVKDIKQILEKSELPMGPESIREPTQADLQAMCEALGLSTEGSIAQLKQRLLKHDDKKPVGVAQKPGTPGRPDGMMPESKREKVTTRARAR